MGCPQPGQRPAPVRPPAGTEAATVFDQIARIRAAAGWAPPTWIERFAPLAQQGAERMGDGGDPRVVIHDVAQRASSDLMRDVDVWWILSDSLYGLKLSGALVGPHSLVLAIGVSLMRAGGAGRYAIMVVILEGGR